MGNGFKVKLMVDELILVGVRVPGRRCTAPLILCSWPSALICCCQKQSASDRQRTKYWSLFSLKCTTFNTDNCLFETCRGHRCLFLSVVSCQVEVSATSWSFIQRSLPIVACLSSITKPRKGAGPGPLGQSSEWRENCLFEGYLMAVSVAGNA